MLKHSVVDSLHWVREQIDVSLTSVQSWLEQYLESPDEGQLLSDSLEELHQISGTLAMLQLDGPVLLTQEMEQALQAAIDEQLGDSQSLYEPMLSGLLGLPDYLGWLQEGGEDIPEALLDAINELREVRGAKPISGADIFARAASEEINTDFRPRLVSDGSDPREVARSSRAPFQTALLQWYKSGEDGGDKSLGEITDIIDRLRDAATVVDNYYIWWAASGFVEALSEGGLPVDMHTRKMLGRIERQIKELAQKGEALYADELPRQVLAKMLYFVGRSATSGKRVSELREAFELDALLPDEDQLQRLRDRLAGPNAQVMGTVAGAIIDDLVSVKEALDVFRRSEQEDTEDLRPLIETLGGIANTLAVLSLPGLENLIRRELEVLENICDGKAHASEDALMEMASSLLTVETRLEGDTPTDISEDEEAEEDEATALKKRLTSPLAVAVFRESIINLARIKERLQEFSGNPQRLLLEEVSLMLAEIRAGLSMLEQERPVEVLADIGRYLDDELLAAGRAPDEKTMELLADTMVSVEYYLEALQEGRRSPESILDTTEGNLDLLRSRGEEGLTEALAGASQADEAAPAGAEETAESEAAGESTQEAAPPRAEARSAPVVALAEGLDDEILEIFIEEAGEVMEELNRWLPVWRENREDKEALTTVRRGYHTLKGSGRMVGAELIGEFAWSVESMLNRVLENTIPADDRVSTVAEQATAALPALIEQLKGNAEAEIPDLETIMENARRVLEGESKLLEPGAAVSQAAGTNAADVADEVEESEAQDAASEPVEETADTDAETLETEDIMPTVGEASTATEETGEGEGDGRMEPLLYDIFSRECATHLSAIAEQMQPAAAGDGPPVAGDDLVRALHTLHGSANMAEAMGIAALAKRLEKLARTMQRHRMVLDVNNSKLFEQASETISDMLDAYGDKSLEMPGHEALCERIEAFEEELAARHETDDEADEVADESAAATSADDAPVEDDSESDETPPETQEATPSPAPAAAAAPDEAELDTIDSMDPDLTEIFVEEASEILSSIDDTLAQWSDQPGKSELNDALLRDLHTLKGSARMAGARNMGDLTHELESLVQAIADGRGEAGDANARLMVRVGDQLNGMLERVRDGVPVAPEHGLAEEMMVARGETPAISSAPAPASEPEPVKQEAEEKPKKAKTKADSKSAKPAEKDKGKDKAEAKPVEDKTAEDKTAEDKTEQKAAEKPAPKKKDKPAAADKAAVESKARPDAEPESAAKESRAPASRGASQEMMRVSADLLDTLLNQAGEVNIYHGRLEQQITALGFNINELAQTIVRLRNQLRDLELETEAQILYRHEKEGGPSSEEDFDPLEMDRYTHVQQLSRALVESVADLESVHELVDDLRRESETLLLQQSRVTTDLQDSLMRTRMVPFSGQTPRLRRIVRQTSAELAKPAKLVVEGDQAELDRSVMERMLAPLEHMLRNAISHGLEEPDERERLGKPVEGEIRMSLRREGSEVVVQVSDDGAGLNLEAIRRKAIERGLTSEGAKLNDSDIMQFILEPGFSTAKEVTQVAGRGVGMDVVDAEIKQLGGSLEIDSTVGKGTIFTVRLPFTLAISQTLLVSAAGETYAVPMVGIEGVVRVPTEQVREYLTGEMSFHEYAGERYEVRGLSSLLGREHMPEPEKGQNRIPLLLVRAGDYLAALAVDSIIGSRETVVKSVGPQVSGIRGIAGATILGDGSVVVILDLGALVRTGFVARISREAEETEGHEAEVEAAAPAWEEPEEEEQRQTVVMVVDDSITVRRVTTRLLERQGMQALTAKDGVDALAQLQDTRPDIMLLDIEMPRMDGFEVATHIKGDEQLKSIPIIMITSRVGEKHRQRALDIGVDEYLGKPYQETELLETIHEVLGRADQQSQTGWS